MKKTQVALAALALVASTAVMANGVQVYGNADGSVISGGGSTNFDGGGGYTTSLIGFRGSEDLGGGLKASFNLETAAGLGNGAIGGGSGGNTGLFNRAANVTLGNDSIGVTMGNTFSVAVAGMFGGATGGAGDNVNVPAVVRMFGGLPGVVVHTGGTDPGTGTFNTLANSGFFIPDALTLRVSAGGLTLKAQTRVRANDATAGSEQSGYRALSISGSADAFNYTFGAQESTGLVAAGLTDEFKTTFVSANTKIGDIGLNGAYARNSGLVTGSTYMVGASYPLSEAASIGAIYARGIDGDNQTSVNLKYSLSKSTVAYATISKFAIDGGTTNYSNTNNAGLTGVTQAISAGISHSF
jgi:predicted porin